MDFDGLASIYSEFLGSHVLIAPEYLLVTLVLAYLIYRLRHKSSGFWRWLVPRNIYLHRSHFLDIKLFLLGRFLSLFGVFNKIAFTSALAAFVADAVAPDLVIGPELNPWMVAAAILLLNDFLLYWVHRIYHNSTFFWPIHSVHHSAEVLTPVTAYRQHPLADVITVLMVSLVFGVAQGLFLGLLAQDFSGTQIAGVNALFFLFAMLTANFRHSHIWISFGPVLEHVIISPAQHQIHHSTAPQHHNKNYGENLAIWDWVFGSLYIPRGREVFEIGIAGADGHPEPQRHTGVIAALVVPLKDMARVGRKTFRADTGSTK